MTILTPTEAEARRLMGCADDDHDVFALGPVPAAVQARLDELDTLINPDAFITLIRDWEHCIVGVLEGDDHFDVIAFTDDGEVGHGGVNLPRFYSTFADLLASE